MSFPIRMRSNTPTGGESVVHSRVCALIVCICRQVQWQRRALGAVQHLKDKRVWKRWVSEERQGIKHSKVFEHWTRGQARARMTGLKYNLKFGYDGAGCLLRRIRVGG
jgi:hypothetical protein